MARYIDADIIREKIEALYDHYLETKNFSADGACSECLELLDDTPTADVVPKSEVDELIRENESLAKTVNEASELIHKLRRKVEKAKAEVAREIFEEIEAEITEAIKCNYKCRTEYYTKERFKKEDGEFINTVKFINTVNGKIDALQGMDDFIAELKKKYTEGGSE